MSNDLNEHFSNEKNKKLWNLVFKMKEEKKTRSETFEPS